MVAGREKRVPHTVVIVVGVVVIVVGVVVIVVCIVVRAMEGDERLEAGDLERDGDGLVEQPGELCEGGGVVGGAQGGGGVLQLVEAARALHLVEQVLAGGHGLAGLGVGGGVGGPGVQLLGDVEASDEVAVEEVDLS